MRASIIDDLKVLLKAKIDCIWIQTVEEKDVIDDILELCKSELGYVNSVRIWSRTEGVTEMPLNDFEIVSTPDGKLKEFPALFSKIRETETEDTGDSCMWILRDFHTVINDPKCQRFIRDLKEYKHGYYNPLVVISPTIEIPSDISRLFRVIEYGLPTEDMIRNVVIKANDYLTKAKNASPKDAEQINVLEPKELECITKAMVGLTIKEIDMALKESMVRYHTLDIDFISRNKIELVKKTGVLDYKIPKTELKDVGGNEGIKEWLVRTAKAFNSDAEAFGVDKPKGFISVGIPGAGKTLLAEAFANEMHLPLLELSMSKIMDKLVGQSERKIDYALQVVKACAPCVFLMDEAEKLMGSAGAGGSSNQSDGGVTNRVFASLLKFMNDNDSGVYVIMTSNDVSALPPEFTRAGRLDAMWYFGLPTAEERRSIFKIHFNHKNKHIGDVILNEAVKSTEGYTGAEIKLVVKNAILNAYNHYLDNGNTNITVDDIKAAIAEVIPVFKSSREKIFALDKYCRGRARLASGIIETKKKTESASDFLLDLK